MDITVYLPDDLARRAKEEGVNLSRTLRDALTAQFEEKDTMAKTLDDATEVILDLEDDGRSYKGRIIASKIADTGDVEVFLTDQENVVAYDASKLQYWVVQDPEEDLPNLLDREAFLEAMDALGITATVELGI